LKSPGSLEAPLRVRKLKLEVYGRDLKKWGVGCVEKNLG
jgi:hypothetical protein